jgi:cytochrome c peroxidase
MFHVLPQNSILFRLIIILFIFTTACMPDETVIMDDIINPSSLKKQIRSVAPNGDLNYYILPSSTDYSSFPNQDPSNPITQEKVELGKLLFYETGLGLNPFVKDDECFQAYSCSSCHLPEFGFTPGSPQGLADGAIDYGSNRKPYFKYQDHEIDVQGHRPLSLVNVSYITNGMWNGMFGAGDLNKNTEEVWSENPFAPATEINETGLSGLEAQNLEGMDLHRLVINDTVLNELGYKPLFEAAFGPGFVEEDPALAFSFAVSAYLRSIYANQAPFQEFLKGDDTALTVNQMMGASLFFDRDKTKCMNCHHLPSFGGHRFARIGTADMHASNPDAIPTALSSARNLGRGGFTQNTFDNYKFKVPQLYNTEDYATYFHGSSKTSLEAVLDYKLKAESENPNVSSNSIELSPIEDLTATEKQALLDFLKYALRDPELERYMPTSVLSGNCFPNNDLISINNDKCH